MNKEMKNMNNEIGCGLNDEDMEIIEEIAGKYNLQIHELGKILSTKKTSGKKKPRLQIRLSDDEIYTIEKRAKEANLSRTRYCRFCFQKAVRNNLIQDIDIMNVLVEKSKGEKTREQKIIVNFESQKDYLDMKKGADELGIPFSTLVRYIVLTFEL